MKRACLYFCLICLSSMSVSAQEGVVTSADIHTQTLSYSVGSWQDQCKRFAQKVISAAGGTLGAGYRQAYLNMGREVTAQDVIPGDIIQITNDSNPEVYTPGYHTAFVNSNNGDGTFDVIDSNWGEDELLQQRSNWNPTSYASSKNLTARFYRLGSEVGNYADNGWDPNGASPVILVGYKNNGGSSLLGPTFDHPNYGPFVVTNTFGNSVITRQYFENSSLDIRFSIVLNKFGTKAYVIEEDFLDVWEPAISTFQYPVKNKRGQEPLS